MRRGRAVGAGLLLPSLLLMSSAAPAADASASRAAKKKATVRTSTSSPTPAAGRAATPPACQHVVKAGETVSRIAARHRVSRQSLTEANRVRPDGLIRPGQRLRIPGCAPAERGGRSGPEVAGEAEVTASNRVQFVKVGPRSVPMRIFLGRPDLDGQVIDFTWPVQGTPVSGFGRRRSGWHAGIDIKAEEGTPIVAAAPGTVYFSGRERAYGRVVKIDHTNGFVTVYAHNRENLVEAGDLVEAGQVIGLVGRSGRATTHHLHFEIRHAGTAYDPAYLLPALGSEVLRIEETAEILDEEDESDG